MAQAATDVRSAGLALFLLIKKKKPYQRIGGIHMLPNLEELKKNGFYEHCDEILLTF